MSTYLFYRENTGKNSFFVEVFALELRDRAAYVSYVRMITGN